MSATAKHTDSIFWKAQEFASPDERAAYLDQACGGDPQLRAQIDELLGAYPKVDHFLESPAVAFAATCDHATTEHIGAMVGRYKLLEQIGEGGMGLVYMAEQQQPVRRLVALKIIKPGFDSKQTIARFEAERQALAMMDHPNIARVLDAGTTEKVGSRELGVGQSTDSRTPTPDSRLPTPSAGRPFFVMELVRGLPINEFCDQKRLTVRARLQLFVQVCQAVQHAHQKGIIHRDLKPTNVLVTMADTVPFPKLLDFGIAKALGQSLTDNTLHTGYSQLVGTPLYMSPEQAEMNLFGVDTRSDVYSLGVLLYELLTGTTPFDKERLTSVTFDEMRRIIREEEPETVSVRLAKTRSANGDKVRSAEFGMRNGGKGSVLSRLFTPHFALRTPHLPELDWIVMKSLEKDRSRRYESASALAADIQRYLSDEPVLACPPTTMYRFQKFARKHKPALATAAAIAACLILGTTVSAWQSVRATQAEAQATANEQKAVANGQKAHAERDEVIVLNQKLAAKEAQLQRTLYSAHMNLAKNAWDNGVMTRVEELLQQHRPRLGESDLRGFEWYYLDRLCHREVMTLKHADWLKSIAYSPDGNLIATGTPGKRDGATGSSKGGEVAVWDAQTGTKLFALQGYREGVAFSPDSKRLAVCIGNKANVVDSRSGKELLAVDGGYVAFSPDGQRLVTGSYLREGTEPQTVLRIWDANTGNAILTIPYKGNWLRWITYSPDGQRITSVHNDSTVKVWDAKTGQELLSLKSSGANPVVFSPDGMLLASAYTIWDAQTGKELRSLENDGPDNYDGVSFHPDGKRLVAGSWSGSVRVFDVESGKVVRRFVGGAGMVAFSGDGRHIASDSTEGLVKIWDAYKSPDYSILQFASEKLTPSPDWRLIAGAANDRFVKIYDLKTQHELVSIDVGKGPIGAIRFSADGKKLAVSAGSHQPTNLAEATVWDTESGAKLNAIQLSKGTILLGLDFSPDGNRLAAFSGTASGVDWLSQSMKVWDLKAEQEALELQVPKGGVSPAQVLFSPSGDLIVRCAGDVLSVWNAKTGDMLYSKKVPPEAAAFSPDGKQLAIGIENTVLICDARTGQDFVTLKGHSRGVRRLAFDPTGKRLAGTAGDKTLKLWDTQSGDELMTIADAGNWVYFSPDGHRLAVYRPNGQMKIYDATPLPEKP